MLRHNTDPKKRPGYSPGLAPIDDLPLDEVPAVGVPASAAPTRAITLGEQTVVGAPPDLVPPGMLTLMRRARPKAPETIEPRQDKLRRLMLAGTVGAGLGVLMRAPGLSQAMSATVQGLRTGFDANAARHVERMRAYTDALRNWESDDTATGNQERLAAHQQALSEYDFGRQRAAAAADTASQRGWLEGRDEVARSRQLEDAGRERNEELTDTDRQREWEREMVRWRAEIDRQNEAYAAQLQRQNAAFQASLPSRSGGGGGSGRSLRGGESPYAHADTAEIEARIQHLVSENGDPKTVSALRGELRRRGAGGASAGGSPIADPSKIVTHVTPLRQARIEAAPEIVRRHRLSGQRLVQWLDDNVSNGYYTEPEANEIMRRLGYR